MSEMAQLKLPLTLKEPDPASIENVEPENFILIEDYEKSNQENEFSQDTSGPDFDTSQTEIVTQEQPDSTQDSSVSKPSKEEKLAEKARRMAVREVEKEQRLLRKQKEEQEKRLKKEKMELERRRKKEQQQKEREEKREKIEHERREKERKKQEEKDRKERERKEKEQKREETRLKKQQEKELREKEKQEKNKSQLTIASFFTKASNSAPPSSPARSDYENAPNNNCISSPIANHRDKSDYERKFLPFFKKENVSVYYPREATPESIEELDELILGDENQSHNYISIPIFKNNPALIKFKTEDVITKINTNFINESEINSMLDQLPIKYLCFYENAKLPYLGTFSQTVYDVDSKLPISPWSKIQSKEIDYNYDSDLEWSKEEDEEGEGEDINGEDDDDEEEDLESDSEADEFVEEDSNNGSVSKKRKLIGPLVPVVKVRKLESTTENSDDPLHAYFNELRQQPLIPALSFPIDPLFSYWAPKKDDKQTVKTIGKTLDAFTKQNTIPTSDNTTVNILTPQKKTITDPAELMKLVDFVDKNSCFSLPTMTELCAVNVLPNHKKNVVKNSIQLFTLYDSKQKKRVINETEINRILDVTK
ncbi:hypothetical protein LJB42_002466 [Komagataella kurtzmanii]|nr:hypothetical protein LJB42_002466 [Komagataella kurtzmanii]